MKVSGLLLALVLFLYCFGGQAISDELPSIGDTLEEFNEKAPTEDLLNFKFSIVDIERQKNLKKRDDLTFERRYTDKQNKSKKSELEKKIDELEKKLVNKKGIYGFDNLKGSMATALNHPNLFSIADGEKDRRCKNERAYQEGVYLIITPIQKDEKSVYAEVEFYYLYENCTEINYKEQINLLLYEETRIDVGDDNIGLLIQYLGPLEKDNMQSRGVNPEKYSSSCAAQLQSQCSNAFMTPVGTNVMVESNNYLHISNWTGYQQLFDSIYEVSFMGKFTREEDRNLRTPANGIVTAQPTAFLTVYCDRRGSFPVNGFIEVTGCTRAKASSQGNGVVY